MALFCKFCGSQQPDNAAHCSVCGGKLEQAPPVAQPVYQQQYQPQFATPPMQQPYPQYEVTPPPKKKNGKVLAIVLAVLAVLLVAAIALFALGSSVEDYQEPIENWAKAIEKDDVDMFYDTYYDLWEELGFNKKDVKKEFQTMIDAYREEIEDELGSDDFKTSVEYGDIEKYDDDDIEKIVDTLEAAGIDDVKIEEAYEIEATIQAKADGNVWETDQYTFVVAKVDGNWSIYQIRGLSY